MELKKFLKLNESNIFGKPVMYKSELLNDKIFQKFISKIVESDGKKKIRTEFDGPKGEMVASWYPKSKGTDRLDIIFGNLDNEGRPLAMSWTEMLYDHIVKKL